MLKETFLKVPENRIIYKAFLSVIWKAISQMEEQKKISVKCNEKLRYIIS